MATTYTIQLKRGLSSSWTALNPILAPGEPGFEIDTGRLKIGNGTDDWINLNYVGENEIVNATTHYDFPSIGRSDVIYKAEEEKKIYQWNSQTLAYEVISEEEKTLDIQIIHGGNSNG